MYVGMYVIMYMYMPTCIGARAPAMCYSIHGSTCSSFQRVREREGEREREIEIETELKLVCFACTLLSLRKCAFMCKHDGKNWGLRPFMLVGRRIRMHGDLVDCTCGALAAHDAVDKLF